MSDAERAPFIHQGIVLPDHLRASLDRYANHGVPTGGFLQACLENNLALATARADHLSARAIPVVMSYIYNELPSECNGRAGVFEEWVARKRKERETARQEAETHGEG